MHNQLLNTSKIIPNNFFLPPFFFAADSDFSESLYLIFIPV